MLFERFSNHCLANAVEPLRAANVLSGRQVYDWQFLTLDGAAVVSSSGLKVEPHGKIVNQAGDYLFVMPSYGFKEHVTWATISALRSAARRFDAIAGFDTGSWLMAEAGLLSGRTATIHWEELAGFSERFPEVTAKRKRYVIDADRITCSGAMAAFDLVMRLLAERHGEALRLEVAALFMSSPVSDVALATPKTRAKAVSRALAIMQEHLEDPLPITEIANRAQVSQKQLERCTHKELGATPETIYRRFRLVLARKLVVETDLPVAEISLRCGYQNASSMTRAFRAEFGETPRAMRQ